jgi:hypothetical protein
LFNELRVFWNASHRGDACTEFLCPKQRAATKSASDVEHIAGQIRRRPPDFGGMSQDALLRIHQTPP